MNLVAKKRSNWGLLFPVLAFIVVLVMLLKVLFPDARFNDFNPFAASVVDGVEMIPTEQGVSAWTNGQGFRIYYSGSKNSQPLLLAIDSDYKVSSAYPGLFGRDLAMEDGQLVLPALDKAAAAVKGPVGGRQYFLVFAETPADFFNEEDGFVTGMQNSLELFVNSSEKSASTDLVKDWIKSLEHDVEVLIYSIEP